MVLEKEKKTNCFGITSVNTALEIMRDEGSMICSLAKEVETIETDPKKAYFDEENFILDKQTHHFVFCGSPVRFLQKKIDEGIRYDMIVIHADRLERPNEIWKRIGILKPQNVILCCEEKEKQEYNRLLMRKHGYRIVEQEVKTDNELSKKFCVGCCNKRYSN